jgi:hypothetical protein
MMKKLKPMTLPHFAAWLAKQPKTKRYNYHDETNCAMAQYGRALYGKRFLGAGMRCLQVKGGSVWFPDDLAHEVSRNRPHTFGGAAMRAKAMLAKKD